MKTFEYKGYDQTGKVARGLIEALDIKTARARLSDRGVFPEHISPAGEKGAKRAAHFSPEYRAMFYRELNALIAADLPLVKALDVIIGSPETGKYRPVLAKVRDRVREGQSTAAALSECARISEYERAALEAGEHSGTLAHVTQRLADYFEQSNRVRQKVRTAMIYPIILVTMCFLLIWLMLFFLLNRYQVMWTEAGIEIPPLTNAVMQFGRVATVLGPLLLVSLIAGIWLMRRRMKHDEALLLRWHRLLLQMPFLKQQWTRLSALRFAGTLDLLLEGGLPLVEAFSLAGKSTGNSWLAKQSSEQADEIRQGSQVADAVRRIPAFASSLPGWVEAGEAGGNLAAMLRNAARRLEEQYSQAVERSLRMLEPLIIVILGGFVFILALAILLPILSMQSAVQ